MTTRAPREPAPGAGDETPDADGPPVPQGRVTLDEYLAFDEAREARHEYVGGYVYAMSGGSTPHERVVGNVFGHLWAAARGGPCAVYAQGLKLRVADDVFCPDVMVVCDPAGTDERMAYAPCLLVEVLSPSTGISDRTLKLDAYRSLPSVRAYWIVSQTWRAVERHWRGDDGVWRVAQVERDGALDVSCPARAPLTLDEVYEGLDLPHAPPGGPPLRLVREAGAEGYDLVGAGG
jgi:Uma2 family endonuclease